MERSCIRASHIRENARQSRTNFSSDVSNPFARMHGKRERAAKRNDLYNGAALARRRATTGNDDGNTKCPGNKTSNATHTCETLTALTVDRIVGGKVVSSFWRAGAIHRETKRPMCGPLPPPSLLLTRSLPRRGRSVPNRSRVTSRRNTFSTSESGPRARMCVVRNSNRYRARHLSRNWFAQF